VNSIEKRDVIDEPEQRGSYDEDVNYRPGTSPASSSDRLADYRLDQFRLLFG